jgi:starch phosphorylase
MNGTINLSVLDGWWSEAHNPDNGWAFGDKEYWNSLDEWDSWDSEELYDILENEIIPLYYNRDENGVPVRWISKMKNSIQSIVPTFNTHRMIKQYLTNLYLPAHQLGMRFIENQFANAKNLAEWKANIEKNWSDISIKPAFVQTKNRNGAFILNFGEKWQVQAKVKLGILNPESVKVQLLLAKNSNVNNDAREFEVFDMKLEPEKTRDGEYQYEASIHPSDSGYYAYTLRVIPYHPILPNPVEMGIVEWCREK